MRRRAFISLIGGEQRGPSRRAQQPAMPVIGFLETVSANFGTRILAPFRQGLGDAGYLEGQNLAIEYRWAEGRYDRLPEQFAPYLARKPSITPSFFWTTSMLCRPLHVRLKWWDHGEQGLHKV